MVVHKANITKNKNHKLHIKQKTITNLKLVKCSKIKYIIESKIILNYYYINNLTMADYFNKATIMKN